MSNRPQLPAAPRHRPALLLRWFLASSLLMKNRPGDRTSSRPDQVLPAGSQHNATANGQGSVYQAGRDIHVSVSVSEPRLIDPATWANLELGEAARRLAGLTDADAAAVLGTMDPGKAAPRMLAMPRQRWGAILRAMDETAAAQRLNALPPEDAAKLLSTLKVPYAIRVFSAFEADRRPQITAALPDLTLVPLLWTLWTSRRSDAVQLLGKLPARRVARLLRNEPTTKAAGVLAALAVPEATAVLAASPTDTILEYLIAQPAKVARLIAALSPERFAALAPALPPDRLDLLAHALPVDRTVPLLAGLTPLDTAELLAPPFPPGKAAQVLVALPAKRRRKVNAELPPAQLAAVLVVLPAQRRISWLAQTADQELVELLDAASDKHLNPLLEHIPVDKLANAVSTFADDRSGVRILGRCTDKRVRQMIDCLMLRQTRASVLFRGPRPYPDAERLASLLASDRKQRLLDAMPTWQSMALIDPAVGRLAQFINLLGAPRP